MNFHYSTNINGCVTEMHLCSKCAAESGYDIGKMFDFDQSYDLGNLFAAMFPIRGGGIKGFMPMAIPVIGTDAFLPSAMQQHSSIPEQGETCSYGYRTNSKIRNGVEVDEEMKAMRELNAQMRVAIENEEFERAAELRDKIKALETTEAQRAVNAQAAPSKQEPGGTIKCDSETISQDSPGAR